MLLLEVFLSETMFSYKRSPLRRNAAIRCQMKVYCSTGRPSGSERNNWRSSVKQHLVEVGQHYSCRMYISR